MENGTDKRRVPRSRVDARSECARPGAPALDHGRRAAARGSQPSDAADEGALGRLDPAHDDAQPPACRLLGVRTDREREGPHAQVLRRASSLPRLVGNTPTGAHTSPPPQFVNFERLDDAVSARKALSGREILGAEVGPIRIGFAKVPTKISHTPFANHVNGDGTPASLSGVPNGAIGSYPHVFGAVSQLSGVTGVPVERQLADGQVQDYRSNLVMGLVSNGHYASAHAFQPSALPGQGQSQGQGQVNGKPVETAKASVNEMQLLMRELSQGDDNLEEHVAAVAGALSSQSSHHAHADRRYPSHATQRTARRRRTTLRSRSPC